VRALVASSGDAGRGYATERRGTAIADHLPGGNSVNWFNLSLVGWIILIIAAVVAALQFDVPRLWVAIGALALFGIAVITSVKHSKPRI
jgi:Na+-translocating ferredoxin:NAD+ oxidoreductase RnfD subunit